MKKGPISYELLTRYLDGTCTPEERSIVEEWYLQWEAGTDPAEESTFDQPAHLAKIKAALENQRTDAASTIERPLGSETKRRWLGLRQIAAAVVLLVGVLGGYRYWLHQQQSTPPAEQVSGTIRVENNLKKVLRHSLPDGSNVWLQPGAGIEYARVPTPDAREIILEGEAFFDVTPDPSRPFRVRSGSVLTTVLGTSFNVQANAQTQQYEVSVVTGKVSVSAPDGLGSSRSVQLLPREQARFDASSGQLTQLKVPDHLEKTASWQPVSLRFEDATLEEVVRKLEKQFGLRIVLNNPQLAHCRIKATFDQQRLPEILEMATQMVEASYEMEGEVITFYGAGCPE
ncbi:FecR domain-containing protein [Rhabdobacter roseus]|uniref:Ferric-dicitrate binding protein FerR (Iron transport regulator) n=1 Tax=Rhabdobacter roseus TaxID=1655419 RepID=A0A840TS36_9BACT|nr:FecR domain-containing protein [Rhabdobacter roseus]MBB5284063.1 ferric-dicitrate binding protein FerR (iron transport regulator) [Rhabdobacter roseus]